MKAHTGIIRRSDVKREVSKEFQERYCEMQASIMHDIAVQLMATVLYTLDIQYNWKGKRLKEFVDAVNDTFSVMDTDNFDNDDNTDYLKRKYSIDLRELIKTELGEVRK